MHVTTAMTAAIARKLPWNDRSGRFSPLKSTCLALVSLPAFWVFYLAATPGLVARPLQEAILQTGNWTIRLLLISLCVTPLRRILNWPKLLLVRRMIGVAALFYALIHLSLYVVDQNLDLAKVASEIILRFYLFLGFLAVLGLTALGLTSTDAMIKRMGAAWRQLHQLVYLLAFLGLVHFFFQSKADVSQPVLLAGFFAFLMGYRLLTRGFGPTPLRLAGLAAAAALLSAGAEAGWYALLRGAPFMKVLAANLNFAFAIRPAWWVLAAGIGVALLDLIGDWRAARRQPPSTTRRSTPRAVAGSIAT